MQTEIGNFGSIRNCTITFSLGARFNDADYVWLARNGWNMEYAPRRFHAIIMRVRSQRAGNVTALVFRSGRVVMTGLQQPPLAAYMARKLTIQLGRVGDGRFAAHLRVRQLRIRNLVGSCALVVTNKGVRVDLHRLSREWRQQWSSCSAPRVHTQFVDYDPAMFPALRSRLLLEDNNENEQPTTTRKTIHATCLVFRTGKFIVTGPLGINQLNWLMNTLYNILTNYVNEK